MWSSWFRKNNNGEEKTVQENVPRTAKSEARTANIEASSCDHVTHVNQTLETAVLNEQTSQRSSWMDWLLRRNRNNSNENPASPTHDVIVPRQDDGSSSSNEALDKQQNNETETRINFIPDPKVVEYFDIFPEFYKQRAVERFSNRKGLNRYDIVRDYFMQRERSTYINSGKFLEDNRLLKEKRQQDIIEKINNDVEEQKQKRLKEGIPDWEKAVLEYLPLNDGDAMWEKLFIATNFSVAGLGLLYSGFTFKRRAKSPGLGQWKLIMAALSGVGACSFLQFAAYYRLYDLGYFNEETDRRGPLTKLEEDIVDTAEVALDKFLDYVDPPGEKPS